MFVSFYNTHYYLQDLTTKETKVEAWLVEGLYLLDHSSFSSKLLYSFESCNSVVNYNTETSNLWHYTLGHAYFDSLCHILDN